MKRTLLRPASIVAFLVASFVILPWHLSYSLDIADGTTDWGTASVAVDNAGGGPT